MFIISAKVFHFGYLLFKTMYPSLFHLALADHGGWSDFSYVTFMMDLSDITRDVFQLIASVDAKFDRGR